MRNKNLILIVDMQNDFCTPSGALYVDGSEKDVQNLSAFIATNQAAIDKIILTQDNHHVIDISHPAFWADVNGNVPAPYTTISISDIDDNTWQAKFFKDEAKAYIKKLSEQGEFPHVIWPEHCIVGSMGAAIVNEVMQAVKNWARKGNNFELFRKGLNPLTEHFGALRANIPIHADEETLLNMKLVETLKQYENIIIAGEAKSHCVANTVKQICEIGDLAKRIIILEDAMSNVKGFEEFADPIYQEAIKKGSVITTTRNLQL